jgi:NADH:quinone reductase (non-electrogenic)
LEPTHITTPLRTSLKRTRVLRSKVAGIDLKGRRVQLSGTGAQTWLRYDHLVVALGAVSSYPRSSTIAERPREFKTLSDAIGIRNHVIDMFERADAELDPDRRRTLLTFVVAGGGFSGTELAGGLNDFARGVIVGYPSLSTADQRNPSLPLFSFGVSCIVGDSNRNHLASGEE